MTSTKTVSSNSERSLLLNIYAKVARIVKADERFRTMLTGGQIAMAYYSPRGQEVVASALMAAAQPDDYLVTIYRGIHDQLAKGIPMRDLWAEFLGKATGTCKGKGGPMHITHPKSGVMVTTGIVGGGIPIANGLALSSQYKKDGKVTICCFGDGASNIGAFHEALNMGALMKLPVVYVCQNNRYAEKTKYEYGTSVPTIAERAGSYGIPGIHVDGNDPIAMYNASRDAMERARSGGGPTLIEAMTFRFMGHFFGDPGEYIPKAEYKEYLEKDPVPLLRRRLLEIGEETAVNAIEAEVSAEVEDAVKFALDSPFPPLAEGFTDIFSSSPKAEVRQ